MSEHFFCSSLSNIKSSDWNECVGNDHPFLQYEFLYALDKDAKLAKAFGAKYTPQIYLFDGEGKLVYKGAIDDNAAKKKKVKKHFLMDAIKAVGGGKEIVLAETKAFGCSIKYPK